MNNKHFKIYNQQKIYVGSIFAYSEGEVRNKSVSQVAGRKQMSQVKYVEDPYEQDFNNIYG